MMRKFFAIALLCLAQPYDALAQFSVNMTSDAVDVGMDGETTTTTDSPSTPPYSVCAQNVRKKILDGYDKIVVPSNGEDRPLNVSVQMTYHTVTSISESQGLVEMFVWLWLRWNDPRLAWEFNPAEDSTCTRQPVNARAEKQQGLKDSEIWVPELDLYNQVTGVNRMTTQVANIEQNGDVTWVRQGPLKAICQLENLGEIPFDDLGCQLLMGSASFGVRYTLYEKGALVVSEYAGPYNGYKLIDSEPGYLANGTTVFFNFKYTRGKGYYIQNIIIPVCIFTYCSIGTLLVGVGAFQTLALNFTLLLTAVAQKIAIGNALPITNERLWLVDFVGGCFYFIAIDILYIFFKFVVLECREVRKRARGAVEDTEENVEGPRETKSLLPELLFTLDMRKCDVMWTSFVFVFFTVYLIIVFTTNNTWGSKVKTFTYVNSTGVAQYE